MKSVPMIACLALIASCGVSKDGLSGPEAGPIEEHVPPPFSAQDADPLECAAAEQCAGDPAGKWGIVSSCLKPGLFEAMVKGTGGEPQECLKDMGLRASGLLVFRDGMLDRSGADINPNAIYSIRCMAETMGEECSTFGGDGCRPQGGLCVCPGGPGSFAGGVDPSALVPYQAESGTYGASDKIKGVFCVRGDTIELSEFGSWGKITAKKVP